MRIPLVTVLICVVLLGHASALGIDDLNKPKKPDGRPHVSPSSCSGCPTAWAYISSTPSLSAVAGLLKTVGLDTALSGDFTGTLVLPTNDAVTSYVAEIKANATAYPDIFNSFLEKLLNYHFILRSAPAWQLDTIALSTRYRNAWTSLPHTVTFVVDKSESKTAPSDWKWSRKHMKNRPMPRVYSVDHIIDEQGNKVSFATKDAFVHGGGVIHTVNAVLGANDIYPSHTASAVGIPEKQAVLELINQVSVGLGFELLPLLETTPGTMLGPTSEAIAALNLTAPDPGQLYNVVSYHYCPAEKDDAQALLYFPFTKNMKYNPCKTFLSAAPALLFGSTPTGVITPQKLFVTYNGPTGKLSTSNVVVTGITTPLAVTHLVDTVLLPPQQK